MTSHDCAQLIRRNEELALLYEKIRINESTLDKGAQQYGLRNREVRTRAPRAYRPTASRCHHDLIASPCQCDGGDTYSDCATWRRVLRLCHVAARTQSVPRGGACSATPIVAQVGLLKGKIRELQEELQGLRGTTLSLETLRNEVYQLQRELLQERTKVRALCDVLSTARTSSTTAHPTTTTAATTTAATTTGARAV